MEENALLFFFTSASLHLGGKGGGPSLKVSFISANYIPRSARMGGGGCKTEVVVVRKGKLRKKESSAARLKEGATQWRIDEHYLSEAFRCILGCFFFFYLKSKGCTSIKTPRSKQEVCQTLGLVAGG